MSYGCRDASRTGHPPRKIPRPGVPDEGRSVSPAAYTPGPVIAGLAEVVSIEPAAGSIRPAFTTVFETGNTSPHSRPDSCYDRWSGTSGFAGFATLIPFSGQRDQQARAKSGWRLNPGDPSAIWPGNARKVRAVSSTPLTSAIEGVEMSVLFDWIDRVFRDFLSPFPTLADLRQFLSSLLATINSGPVSVWPGDCESRSRLPIEDDQINDSSPTTGGRVLDSTAEDSWRRRTVASRPRSYSEPKRNQASSQKPTA